MEAFKKERLRCEKNSKQSVVKAMKKLCNYTWHEAAFKN